MDPIFDRFGRLMRSWFSEDDSDEYEPDSPDADYRDAWEELEDYLSSDNFKTSSTADSEEKIKVQTVPDRLIGDYKTLGVPLDATLIEIKKAYKKKILTYHPDRFAADSEAQKVATRKAAVINDSFRRIEIYFETGS